MDELLPQELARYARQITLEEIGLSGQQRLKLARVLVIGAGGLGCPVLLYLAAAGVGSLGIVEHDTVDESNLQRQILYTVADVGQAKARAAERRLTELNPHVQVRLYPVRFDAGNALDIVAHYDIVVDATDNFTAKYLINDACVIAGRPMIYASISQFEGQMAVFNAEDPITGGRGPNYRDLFPEPPPRHLAQNCAEAGVLGVLPGLLGCWQAMAVLKLITQVGAPTEGHLMLLDARTLRTRLLKVSKRPDNPLNDPDFLAKGLQTVEVACSMPETPTITPAQMQAWMSEARPFQLVDVRGQAEHRVAALGEVLIPLPELPERLKELDLNLPVIFYCKSGMRSQQAVLLAQRLVPGGTFLSLAGGIEHYETASAANATRSPLPVGATTP